jgi:hypothetical protein
MAALVHADERLKAEIPSITLPQHVVKAVPVEPELLVGRSGVVEQVLAADGQRGLVGCAVQDQQRTTSARKT